MAIVTPVPFVSVEIDHVISNGCVRGNDMFSEENDFFFWSGGEITKSREEADCFVHDAEGVDHTGYI